MSRIALSLALAAILLTTAAAQTPAPAATPASAATPAPTTSPAANLTFDVASVHAVDMTQLQAMAQSGKMPK